jgi:hypothetical protein
VGDTKEVFVMAKKGFLMTSVALGAAYLLRNPKSWQKIINQFQAFAKKV